MEDSEIEHLLRAINVTFSANIEYNWYILLANADVKKLCSQIAERALVQRSASMCTLMLKLVAVTDENNAFYKKYSWLRKYLPRLLGCLSEALSHNHFDIYAQTRILCDCIRLAIAPSLLGGHARQLFLSVVSEGEKILQLPNFIFVSLFHILAYFSLTAEAGVCVKFLGKFETHILGFPPADLARIYNSLSQFFLVHSATLLPLIEQVLVEMLEEGTMGIDHAIQLLEGLSYRKGDFSFNLTFCSRVISFFRAHIFSPAVKSASFKRIFILCGEIAEVHPLLLPIVEKVVNIEYINFFQLPFFHLLFFLEAAHTLLTNKRVGRLTPLHKLYAQSAVSAFKAYLNRTGEVHPVLVNLPQLWNYMLNHSRDRWQALTPTSRFVLKYILVCSEQHSLALSAAEMEPSPSFGFRLIEFDFPAPGPRFLEYLLPPLHELMRLPLATYKIMRFLDCLSRAKIKTALYSRMRNLPHRYFDMRRDDSFRYRHFFAYTIALEEQGLAVGGCDFSHLIFSKQQLVSDLTVRCRMLKILRCFASQLLSHDHQYPGQRLLRPFYFNDRCLFLLAQVIIPRCGHAALIEGLKGALSHAEPFLKKVIIEGLTAQLIKIDCGTSGEHLPENFSLEVAFLYPHFSKSKGIVQHDMIGLPDLWQQLSNPFHLLNGMKNGIVDQILVLDHSQQLRAFVWLMARNHYLSEEGILGLALHRLSLDMWNHQYFYEELFRRLELFNLMPLECKEVFLAINSKIQSAFDMRRHFCSTLCEQIARLAVRLQTSVLVPMDPHETPTLTSALRLQTLLFRSGSPSATICFSSVSRWAKIKLDTFRVARALHAHLINKLVASSVPHILQQEILQLLEYFAELRKQNTKKHAPNSLPDFNALQGLVWAMADACNALLPLRSSPLLLMEEKANHELWQQKLLLVAKYAKAFQYSPENIHVSSRGPFLYMRSSDENRLLILASRGLLSSFYAEFFALFSAKRHFPTSKCKFIADANADGGFDAMHATHLRNLDDTWENFAEDSE